MIIGETFNNDYDGYEEDSYDYLFKRKTKEERQQKRSDRKEKRQEKRSEKQQQKQDPSSGGKRKLPILGNFGLFDKNKNKKGAGTSTSGSTAKKEPGESAGSSTSEDTKQTAEAKLTAAGAAAASQDKSEGNTPGSESGASETAKPENKELDKNGNPKKEAGFGPMFGFAMLGITVLVIGAVLYGTNKRSKEILPPMKVAA